VTEVGGGGQGRGGAGAGAEVAEGKLAGLGMVAKPASRRRQPPAQKRDVEHVGAVELLLGGEQVEQQRRESVVVELLGDLAVAGAQAARSAAVGERDDSARVLGDRQNAGDQHSRPGLDQPFMRVTHRCTPLQ
jgi:hypothetical protein